MYIWVKFTGGNWKKNKNTPDAVRLWCPYIRLFPTCHWLFPTCHLPLMFPQLILTALLHLLHSTGLPLTTEGLPQLKPNGKPPKRTQVKFIDACHNEAHAMMTSSNGDIFRVTHLCGEFNGPRWIPHPKAISPWINMSTAPHKTSRPFSLRNSWGFWKDFFIEWYPICQHLFT